MAKKQMSKNDTRAGRKDLGVYIDPLTDFGFKRLFKEKELLIDFLHQVLPAVKIEDVHYEDKELLGFLRSDRRAVLDLLCKTDSGEYVMVEMQRAKQNFFTDRVLFYGANLIRMQAKRGHSWDYELKAVYVVSLLNFSLVGGTENVIDRVALMNTETKEVFSEKLQFTFIQLPHFTKTADELKGAFDAWLFCLKHLWHLNSPPTNLKGGVFKKIFEIMKVNQLNQEDMKRYRKSVDEYDDIQDAIMVSKRESEAIGIAIGEARGIALGIERERRNLVKILLSSGMNVKEISDMTKIPLNDVIHYTQN
jgi:predicted transposase/invertase (TIGR01784 family)